MRRLAPLLLLIAAAGCSLFLGRYPAPGFASPGALLADPLGQRLLLDFRLPRIVAGILLGASMAAAGTVFQMVFANPLVEPGFLGVSQGAAFGAALAIVALPSSPLVVQAAALVCALVGLGVSYLAARALRFGGWVLRLVLAGIAVSALFSAGIGALKLGADPTGKLPEITFWLLGGLWSVGWRDVLFLLPPVLAGLLAIWLFRFRLDLLSLDDRVAHALGAAVDRERLALLFAATLAAAAAVAVSGLVGWVGLLAPHAARRLAGASSRAALPSAMLLGATLVLVCDDIARTALPIELPLGILTALVGASAFLVLMASRAAVGSER